MRLLVSRSWSIFVVAVLLASAAKIYASTKKEWVTLSDCQYLDAVDNDGDSFAFGPATKSLQRAFITSMRRRRI
jgi:hypothetical protein